MAVLPPVHHIVAVLVAGYCVGSVELGSVSVEQTLDISNLELAVHRICDCLANTKKNCIISCHGCHIWKILKFRFRSSKFKFKFKSRCCMGPLGLGMSPSNKQLRVLCEQVRRPFLRNSRWEVIYPLMVIRPLTRRAGTDKSGLHIGQLMSNMLTSTNGSSYFK